MFTKRNLRIALFVVLVAIALPASSAVIAPATTETNSPVKTEDPRAQQLVQRLKDIKGMDKSGLTKSEKKSLRKEVKGIKKEMKDNNRGVYLSVGAIIIIILLLILIL